MSDITPTDKLNILFNKYLGYTRATDTYGSEWTKKSLQQINNNTIFTHILPESPPQVNTYINITVLNKLTGISAYSPINYKKYISDNPDYKYLSLYEDVQLTGYIHNPDNTFYYSDSSNINILINCLTRNITGNDNYTITVTRQDGSDVDKSFYVIDSAAGIIRFYNNTGISQLEPPKITFWRYEGPVGLGYDASNVYLGTNAGLINQQPNAISIGTNAGRDTQGSNAIAIGTNAGYTSQHANSIILNASDASLNSVTPGFFVNPIREIDTTVATVTPISYYNPVTKELQYGKNTWSAVPASSAIDMSGNKILRLAEPTDPSGATTKFYVDTAVSNITTYLADPSTAWYNIPARANVDISANRIINLADPSGNSDAVTKKYVDNAVYNSTIHIGRYATVVGSNIITAPYDSVTIQESYAIGIGYNTGSNGQKQEAVAIGRNAGRINQGIAAVALGLSAGCNTQGSNAVAIGTNAGLTSQSSNSVAIGSSAGRIRQNVSAIAIGQDAGYTDQSGNAIAIGQSAGRTRQNINAIAIGQNAGWTDQSGNAIALGQEAGRFSQNVNAIAIGQQAGFSNQSQNTIAIGQSAGNTSQNADAIAIGQSAGWEKQSGNAIAIGNKAALNSQGSNAIALGQEAGRTRQNVNAIAIGQNAGYTDQSGNAIAIGQSAGNTRQNVNAIAIGQNAGFSDQSGNAIAIGNNAAATSQSSFAIAIGQNAGNLNQNVNAIAIGQTAGNTRQNVNAIAIGQYAGRTDQSGNAIAIGYQSGYNKQKTLAIAIGQKAGCESQGQNGIAIGEGAGFTSQKDYTVAIGYNAGESYQEGDAIAIGNSAGLSVQGTNSIAVGKGSGKMNQSIDAVAIGSTAGNTSQGTSSIAIGKGAGYINQFNSSVAIGENAGYTSQGTFSVAIGTNAGKSSQSLNSIILNASGLELNTDTSGLFINPIRQTSNSSIILTYNTTTKEIQYTNNDALKNLLQSDLDMSGNKIIRLAEPIDPSGAATKYYVDNRIDASYNTLKQYTDGSFNTVITRIGNLDASYNDLSNSIVTSQGTLLSRLDASFNEIVTNVGTEFNNVYSYIDGSYNDVITYVDSSLNNLTTYIDNSISSSISSIPNWSTVKASTTPDISNNRIINVADPSNNQDVATKNYVDNKVNPLDQWLSTYLLSQPPVIDVSANFPASSSEIGFFWTLPQQISVAFSPQKFPVINELYADISGVAPVFTSPTSTQYVPGTSNPVTLLILSKAIGISGYQSRTIGSTTYNAYVYYNSSLATAGSTIYVTVYYKNSSSQQPNKITVPLMTFMQGYPPSAVRFISATSITATSATVQWTAPQYIDSTPGNPKTYGSEGAPGYATPAYTLVYQPTATSKHGGISGLVNTTSTQNYLSQSDTPSNLYAGTTYKVTITAKNDISSTPSPDASGTFTTTLPPNSVAITAYNIPFTGNYNRTSTIQNVSGTVLTASDLIFYNGGSTVISSASPLTLAVTNASNPGSTSTTAMTLLYDAFNKLTVTGFPTPTGSTVGTIASGITAADMYLANPLQNNLMASVTFTLRLALPTPAAAQKTSTLTHTINGSTVGTKSYTYYVDSLDDNSGSARASISGIPTYTTSSLTRKTICGITIYGTTTPSQQFIFNNITVLNQGKYFYYQNKLFTVSIPLMNIINSAVGTLPASPYDASGAIKSSLTYPVHSLNYPILKACPIQLHHII
jgi:hypothetical protein